MPMYAPRVEEVRRVIETEGSHNIDKLESYELRWDAGLENGGDSLEEKHLRGKHLSKLIRAVLEALLESHFGNAILDDLFQRFCIKATEHMEMGLGIQTNVIISLTKK